MADQIQAIKELLNEVNPELLARPNVVATGIGYKTVLGQKTGQLAIICSVETKISAALLDEEDLIPSLIGEYPTDVQPVGTINALQLPTGRFRPAPGGVSAGHVNITSGTLGCFVTKGDKVLILSNNHVLANSNQAKKGDIILQPGPHDGGRVQENQIARLTEFIPIHFENEKSNNSLGIAFTGIFNFFARLAGSKVRLYSRRIQQTANLVDSAIAEVTEKSNAKNEILQIGIITGVAEGALDMKVKKSGRTTGLTHGTIEQVNVTVRVNFGAGKTALFTDQLMADAMSHGGDSGSVVLNGKNEVVGLLFAGSTTATIINRIQNVTDLLGVELI
jgi:hypothetical protein